MGGTSTINSICSSLTSWPSTWMPFCSQPQSNFWQRQISHVNAVLGVSAVITSTTETFHSCVKFLIDFTEAVSPRFILEHLSVTVIQLDVWIDGVRFISDIKQALELKYLADFIAKKYALAASGVCFFIADLGSAMSLLGHFKVIPLDKVFAYVSSVRIFGLAIPNALSHIVVGTFSLQYQTGAFLFLGIHKGVDFFNGDNCKRNLIWIITCIWEVIHKGFLFFAGPLLSTPYGIVAAGVFGMAANGFGVWSAYTDVVEEKK